ncbi:MAG: antibiotic biosynthesis monooxygenase [Flavobacteriales bacterium]|nr:antibiotic biosynthesis monooxygenase [Flavobacteriales bacterium]
MKLAPVLKPPYYAVIFTSLLTDETDDYGDMATKMVELCSEMPGFLGMDSARSEVGITVCYWKDLDSIENWKKQGEHLFAQKMGKEKWYKSFTSRVAKVEKAYGFDQ